MEIAFRKLFLAGCFISLTAALGTLFGPIIFGVILLVDNFGNKILRNIVGIIVVLTIGLPSAIVALVLYGLCWLLSSMTSGKTPMVVHEVPLQGQAARDQILDGEFRIIHQSR